MPEEKETNAFQSLARGWRASGGWRLFFTVFLAMLVLFSINSLDYLFSIYVPGFLSYDPVPYPSSVSEWLAMQPFNAVCALLVAVITMFVISIDKAVMSQKEAEKMGQTPISNNKSVVITSVIVTLIIIGGMYWQIQLSYPLWRIAGTGLFAVAALAMVWWQKRS